MKLTKYIKEDFEILHNYYEDKFKQLEDCSILITGANGMITTYLSMFLAYWAPRHNIELFLQCRNIPKAEEAFSDFIGESYVHLLQFDFEKNEIPQIKFDYIIHAASPASTKFFIESPVDVISPNIIGTWNLLNYAKNNSLKKFLLFSSNSIYGEGGVSKNILEETDYGIVDPLNVRSSYLESKRMAEQMGIAFYRQYNVPVSSIRICHTYGPTFDIIRDSRIIPRVINQILRDEDIVIYKDPDSVIQYTYIADMTAAILSVLLNGKDGESYNAGGDEIVKMDEVIGWMVHADAKIKSSLIEKEPDGEYKFGKGNGVNFLKIANNKLSALGWKQLFTNEEGFKRTVKSYLENRI